MKHSSDSTPDTAKAMEADSVEERNLGSIDGVGPDAPSGGDACLFAEGGATAPAKRREAPGVSSSNTPPQSSKKILNQTPHWIAAEDWLEWSVYIDWGTNWPKFSRQLLKKKELAAIAGCPKDVRSIPFWGGSAEVDRMGARMGHKKNGLYFAYRLTTEFLTILIADREEPHKTRPSAVIRASGDACLMEGAQACYEAGNDFIKQMGGTIIGNKLSRVDVCLDMPGETITAFDLAYFEQRYICRARSHGRYESGGITVQFGKYPLMLRVYDKKEEVLKKKQALQILGMMNNRWGGKMPDTAIRVELELGRDFLKKKGVDSVEDYYQKRGALLNYLTHDWMRFTQDQVDRENKNQSKTKTLPLWQQVRDFLLEWSGSGQGVSLSPLDKTKANVAHLIKVAAGVVKAAATDQGESLKTPEDMAAYLLERIKLYGVSAKTG